MDDELTEGVPLNSGIEPDAQSDREAAPVDNEEPPRLPFPVVGIGASAGGLEAVTEFVKAMRPDSGMAFVLVQHLPPDRESMMVEILARHTRMPVQQVVEGMAVEPNHFYVIRPGHTLMLKSGAFHLGESLRRPGNNRPVDDFFKSLASEQRERGIGIILSGMGSNGAAGAQAIKAVGGLCIAQEPETAQFPSMPRHLIDAGYADYILRPADMADTLLAYAGHPYASGGREADASNWVVHERKHLREILAILRTRTQKDFTGYKKPTILRRVQRRMGLNRTDDLAHYAKILRQSPSEVTALADDLLIHVTGFFRDPEAWTAMHQAVIAPLVAAREPDSSIRCWVTACSSGEEAYTLAMLLVEEAERISKPLDIKVFATDMADRTLQNARGGVYPGGIESEITPERLERFFQKEDEVYRVRPELRERVVFAPQNVLQDPPFSRLDIVTCRNLLIYLEPEVQQRVITMLHFGLREGGALFLGSSETAGVDDLFEPIDKKQRIFRRLGPTRHGLITFPLPHGIERNGRGERAANIELPQPTGARPAMSLMINRALLDHHTPAAVAVDRDNRIVYYHGETEMFIAAPRGEPTRDLMLLVRENVRGAVRTAVHRVRSQGVSATVPDGCIMIEPDRRMRVSVTASPLDARNAHDYLVISFHVHDEPEIPAAPHHRGANGQDATSELRRIRDELQSTVEELQTSNEELKASHEELVSTNEELQSSNEELETSREEMQSLNEELTTVNAQLHAKMEEHQAASNDLSSLLTSTDIAVLFLDRNFRIRRFTPQVRELMDMIASDIGRPLDDLAKKFTDDELVTDAETVLQKLVPIEREISADGGQWFLRRVTPYRTGDNRIDGVVITFVEISARRRAEDAMRVSEERFRSFAENSISGLWIADAETARVEYLSSKFDDIWGVKRQTLLGGFDRLEEIVHVDDRASARAHVNRLLAGENHTCEFRIVRPENGAVRIIEDNGFPIADGTGVLRRIGGIQQDVTEDRLRSQRLRESEERFRLLVAGARDLVMIMLDATGRITIWNEGATRVLGFDEAEAVGQHISIIFTRGDRIAGEPEKVLNHAAQTGRATEERWHVRKDGRRFWGSGVLTTLRDPAGGLTGFVKVLRDETARKRAEEALKVSKESAELANRMKDEFLATLSHELRTPLSSILIWSKMLAAKGSPTSDFAEGLDAIVRSADAQKELIDDLLDTARITSGKLRLEIRPTELKRVVQNAIDAVRPTVEAKEVEITADLAGDVGVVRVDPDRMQQVLWNLLTNAVKFTPAGGRVDVVLLRRGRQVEIRVTDTGKGIDPVFLPHVFEPFRQAESSTTRAFGGLGLGLAICKKLVEQHGGSISVTSDGANQGSTFKVILPLPKVRSTEPGNHARADFDEAATASSQPLAGKRVLLVEDDADTRLALEALLRQGGATVTPVGSAAAAMTEYDQSRPDAIVSDVGMPVEDGYSLIRRIRRREIESMVEPVPAVAVTAFARDEDRDQAMAAGFHRHVGKPVDPQMLLSIVESVIRLH